MRLEDERLDPRACRTFLASDGRRLRVYLAPIEPSPAFRGALPGARAACFETWDGAWIGRTPASGVSSVAGLAVADIEALLARAELRG